MLGSEPPRQLAPLGDLRTCTRCLALVDVVTIPDDPPDPETFVCVLCLTSDPEPAVTRLQPLTGGTA